MASTWIFHPHLHALVADGLFTRSGLFHACPAVSSLYCGVLPDVSLWPLEELFRARVITFLAGKGLLPPERANMLRGWVHSEFNVHRSRRVLPDEREDLERLAQYIIRNPFSVESRAAGETGCPEGSNGAKRSGNMQVNQAGDSIIYRSAMNPKSQRKLPFASLTAAAGRRPVSLRSAQSLYPLWLSRCS